MKRLLAILLLATLLTACAPAVATSALSEPTQASLDILIDQLQLDECSAIDILAQLRRAGYTESVRMAFATEQENTYRLWLEHTALDITLDDQGLLSTIRDGETLLSVTAPSAQDTPPGSAQEPDKTVENPVDIVDNPEKTDQNEPENDKDPVENSPQTLQLVSLTSPITAGKQATLRARGLAGAEYDISVRYASGESTAAGLEPQRADENGMLEWTFRVSSRVAEGDYPVTVSGEGESLQLTLRVVAP